MHQLILDNQNFIYYLFNVTAGGLQVLSLLTGLSYQWWNIVIWFGIIPSVWIYMIGRRTSPWINLISIVLFLIMFTIATWNKWFDQAVVLLNDLCRVFGPDYRQMSVYICLFVPLIITVVLGFWSLSKRANRILIITLSAVVFLIIVGFPVSNYLLPKYKDQLQGTGKIHEDALKILK